MTLLIDDQILAAHLQGRSVVPSGEPPYTTGYWYVPICRAVSRRAGGTLSGPFAALPPQQRKAAVSAVLELPTDVGLLSLRQLGPLIGELGPRHQPMNTLSREALAAAVQLSATVLIAEGNENRTLITALETEGLSFTVTPAR